MSLIKEPEHIMLIDKAIETEKLLNGDPDDNWAYQAVVFGSMAKIAVYDDSGAFMGYL